MSHSFGIVIQARMSSSRCPGKMLRCVSGKPMLQYLLERLTHWKINLPIIVATSEDPSDNCISDFCKNQKFQYFRGDLKNVAERFSKVVEKYDLETFIRISGDSPFLDPLIIQKAIEIFNMNKCDIVTNIMPRSYPAGQSVEIIQSSKFLETYSLFSEPGDFEHVTKYFYRNKDKFNINNFSNETDMSNYSMTVDTETDWERFGEVVKKLTCPHYEYKWEELLRIQSMLELEANDN